ncbi:ABC transporter ATP-binding protein [Candidatus Poribacteria bacterium]|nr:ABC transporter ATP-binding protein [Candidatus Poribacteria bacterium]
MALISLQNITKQYHLGQITLTALKQVNLTIERGDFVAIIGPSGSGKTTLLNLIGCIDLPTSGSIAIDGQVIDGLSHNRLAELRAEKIGFIFQHFNLFPVLSASENVEYSLLRNKRAGNSKVRKAKVSEMLARVGMADLANHRPNQLSGGQQQRVAIARALVSEPQIVLADEPTANLDSQTSQSVLNLMKQMSRGEQITFIFATHDPEVMGHAERVIALRDGQIVEK